VSEQPQSLHDFGALGQGIYSHGTRANYQAGCHCLPCRSAEAGYQASRAQAKAKGLTGWVDATAASDHLLYLAQHQVGLEHAAMLSGVSVRTLQAIRNGRPRICKAIERRILLTRAIPALGAHVNGYRTRHLLLCLFKEGYTRTQLARLLGLRTRQIRLHHEGVTVKNAVKVRALYRRLTAE
jgi:hypothetical protein